MFKQLRPECGCDELGSIRQLVDHIGYSLSIHWIKCLVNLVKQVEWGRVTFLDGENECHGNQGLLPSTQLVHLPHLIVLPGEADCTGHPSRIFKPVRLVVVIVIAVIPLDGESAPAKRAKLLKYLLEVL